MEKPGDPKLGRFAVAVQRYLFNPFFFPPPFSSLPFPLVYPSTRELFTWITNANKGGARESRWFSPRSEEEKGFAKRKLNTRARILKIGQSWLQLGGYISIRDGKGPTEPWRGLIINSICADRGIDVRTIKLRVHFENTWKEECRLEEDGRRGERKKGKKCGRETGLRGGEGEEACKLACGGDSI